MHNHRQNKQKYQLVADWLRLMGHIFWLLFSSQVVIKDLADEMEENASNGACMLQNLPAMAKTAAERAGHPPANIHRDQNKRQGNRNNSWESPADSRMADISPTMAEANPERAGQSPEDWNRQHSRIADKTTRWAGNQLSNQQGTLEGAVDSQAT